MDRLENLSISSWQETISPEVRINALSALEDGKILFLPNLSFEMTSAENLFLAPQYVDPKSKNISFDSNNNKLGGARGNQQELQIIKEMMQRYSAHTNIFIRNLIPHYNSALQIGRTSFRPVEIIGRESSYRKDDTRLHVDAFPATPNQGKRILRVFTNVNPTGKNRVWRVGESFTTVATKFLPQLSKPFPGSAKFLQLFKITKSYRTLYDHFMLQMHNGMKADMQYQQSAQQNEIKFPSGSTWIVYTDCVSHAAMAGQHLFEQTFYLPVQAMQNEMQSPLRILEKIAGHPLI